MPVREQLPLTLPAQAAAQVAAQQQERGRPPRGALRPPATPPARREHGRLSRRPAASYAGTVTETRPVGWLSRTLQRLTADDQTIDAQELRAEVGQRRLRAAQLLPQG